MPRFVSIDRPFMVVKARQYRAGEIVYDDDIRPLRLDEALVRVRNRWDVVPLILLGLVVGLDPAERGAKVRKSSMMYPGDWLVTFPNGKRAVCGDDNFREVFAPKE